MLDGNVELALNIGEEYEQKLNGKLGMEHTAHIICYL